MTVTGAERRMLIVSHTYRAEAIAATAAVIRALHEAGVTPVMELQDRADFARHVDVQRTAVLAADATGAAAPLGDEAGEAATELPSGVPTVPIDSLEAAIVLGGDGTILRAAEILRGSACPIVGVNLGHVGFLAEMESRDLNYTIERVLARSYTVEERMTLAVRAELNGELIADTWALNEATVEKQRRMLEVAVGVDAHPVSTFACDGVVLATPTGSTAYAFSAGGPIVWPSVQALLMVPIAAHALFNRPLVAGPDSELTVRILPENVGPGVMWCDGRRRTALPAGAIVRVRRSSQTVRIARLDEAPFSERLVRKFNLPVTGWRGDRSSAA